MNCTQASITETSDAIEPIFWTLDMTWYGATNCLKHHNFQKDDCLIDRTILVRNTWLDADHHRPQKTYKGATIGRPLICMN